LIFFIATNPDWGGSEELWCRAADHLLSKGMNVAVAIQKRNARVDALEARGADVRILPTKDSLIRRAWEKVREGKSSFRSRQVGKALASRTPALTVVSDGGCFRSIDILELLVAKRLPFVTITQAVSEDDWPDDEIAKRHRRSLSKASGCFFVSEANLRLFETQLGEGLSAAMVVRNPYNVDFDCQIGWPPLGDRDTLRLACVGRLHPPSKGHHLLLEALSDPVWRTRSWTLSIYGSGTMRESIACMIERYQLKDRVRMVGYEPNVVKIWAENHLLVMPSRYEGLPLAIVEAMLCRRAVLATDVAGHAEVISDNMNGFLAGAPTAKNVLDSLNRVWQRRSDLEAMGKAAGESIRRQVSRDPSLDFAEMLTTISKSNSSPADSL
jgi:glycosyltransferase involved in cell wall biosynthesis